MSDISAVENLRPDYGFSIQALCIALQNNPPGIGPCAFTREDGLVRLEAVSRLSSNVLSESLNGIKTVGELLSHASASGDLPADVAGGAGALIRFLGEIVELMDDYKKTSRRALEHGTL